MKIRKTVTIKAPPENVWDVLGKGYESVDSWASSVNVSTGNLDGGTPKAGATCSGRTCESSIGPVKETIRVYDEVARIISYDATAEKMPGFVKGINNRWETIKRSDGHSDVHMVMTADLSGLIGLIMTPIMKIQMGILLGQAVQELTHYLETGKPHPRKVKAAAKYKKAIA